MHRLVYVAVTGAGVVIVDVADPAHPVEMGRFDTAKTEVRTPAECHAAMTWAQRLKRVFSIDIENCSRWRVVTAVVL